MHRLIHTALRSLALVATLAVLAGCATTGSYDNYLEEAKAREDARQARLEILAADCQDDLCRVMIAQELSEPMNIPQPRTHPGWRLAETFLGAVVPAASNFLITRENRRETIGIMDAFASIERADNSITVGGNYGDTDQSTAIGGDQIGGDRIDDRSVGRDRIGGDQRVGDEYNDSCVGQACRNVSDGPIDNSDRSDNSDNSGGGDEGGDP